VQQNAHPPRSPDTTNTKEPQIRRPETTDTPVTLDCSFATIASPSPSERESKLPQSHLDQEISPINSLIRALDSVALSARWPNRLKAA
jgi:hypothetical protein